MDNPLFVAVSRALFRAVVREASTIDVNTPIIAITTRSSIKVKPLRYEFEKLFAEKYFFE